MCNRVLLLPPPMDLGWHTSRLSPAHILCRDNTVRCAGCFRPEQGLGSVGRRCSGLEREGRGQIVGWQEWDVGLGLAVLSDPSVHLGEAQNSQKLPLFAQI